MVNQNDLREAAIKRLKDKSEFRKHLITYLVINGMMIGIWALTGQGYFWPVWVIGGWGVGLILHGWTTFYSRSISEADIQREMARGK